jgi:carbamoyl-phosphate synthase small subunit
MKQGFLVLETGEIFPGFRPGDESAANQKLEPNLDRAGEVVFNTSHGGYEEMATDPSYYSQILVLTAPQMGNYGENDDAWESENIWISGFVCVEMQDSKRDHSWAEKLTKSGVPILTGVDTRKLVFRLRDAGTPWGAIVFSSDATTAQEKATKLIAEQKKKDKDWVHHVAIKAPKLIPGKNLRGPKIAAFDFGCKTNSLRELIARSKEIKVFPPRTPVDEIKAYNPDGIFLSNGPGDPLDVQVAPDTVKQLVGWRFIFGICMGHQILGRALGGQTYKLKFGHRGSNHPIKDSIINKIYMTSQNHGYAVKQDSLPESVQVSHVNLNDHTVAGIYDPSLKIMSVQFHPESHPGPHDAVELFDFFVRQTQ